MSSVKQKLLLLGIVMLQLHNLEVINKMEDRNERNADENLLMINC